MKALAINQSEPGQILGVDWPSDASAEESGSSGDCGADSVDA